MRDLGVRYQLSRGTMANRAGLSWSLTAGDCGVVLTSINITTDPKVNCGPLTKPQHHPGLKRPGDHLQQVLDLSVTTQTPTVLVWSTQVTAGGDTRAGSPGALGGRPIK